jgi:hypothetical protein
MEWEELYAGGIEDCKKPEQIRRASFAVAAAIRDGDPIEIALAPGNGTRYCWLFVPILEARRVDAGGGYFQSDSVGSTGVWIADLNLGGGVYPLSFGGGRDVPYPTYISEKWFNGKWNYDLVVFYELLRQILEELNP